MKVPLLDPVKCNQAFQEELNDAALKVLHSGKYILGEVVEEFEQSCCEYLGVKHAIGVGSGTDALMLSLLAIEADGYPVICPSFTFFATAGSGSLLQSSLVFVDVNEDDFTIDVNKLEEYLSSKTHDCWSAIIPVHLFGQCADMDVINNLAKDYNCSVIEDACQAIGAEYKGKKAGGLADLGCFSFFPSKNLGGFGDAGLITTNDDQLAEKVKLLRVHGGEGYIHRMIGGNFRIDALQAALLNVKLKYLPEMEKARNNNAQLYLEGLKDTNYVLPCTSSNNKHVFNQFTIKTKKRDKLMYFLKQKGISSAVYYPLPLDQQPCFNSFVKREKVDLVSNKLSKQCLSLPVAAEISTEQIEYTIDCLKQFD